MLKPAILYKDELTEEFAKRIYTKGYFYYVGYPYSFSLPKIEVKDNYYQYAIVDEDDKLLGYLAYTVCSDSNNVCNFGLYSFDEGNIRVIRDVYKELERLINRFHRVEWRCIGGNHAAHGYDAFCKKHGGNKIILHDVIKDLDGNYVDEYVYEIINKEN